MVSFIPSKKIYAICKMNKDDIYYFHQTPSELAIQLLATVPLIPSDVLYEPFKGEGAFYNNFPPANVKKWTELVENKDYKDFNEEYDWVITNPPFRLQEGTQRVNAFWLLLDYFTDRARKGVAFLVNDNCFSSLTPLRLAKLKEKGWYIHFIKVCAVKKWRGRYFFIVFKKEPSNFYGYISGNY